MLSRTEDSGHISELLLFLSLARNTREFFSYLHSENLIGLLEVKNFRSMRALLRLA